VAPLVNARDPLGRRGGLSPLRITGDIDRDVAALLIEQLAALDEPVTIDLSEADIDDGRVIVMLVDALRRTKDRLGRLTLIGPPQVLAHTLYRTNDLDAFDIVEPRQELGTTN